MASQLHVHFTRKEKTTSINSVATVIDVVGVLDHEKSCQTGSKPGPDPEDKPSLANTPSVSTIVGVTLFGSCL